ncbi:MAG TPA: hypothetical protein PLB55_24390 [Prosthecobacter sp.]|nr:hypothetical protein [Prosthecobacter sp.]
MQRSALVPFRVAQICRLGVQIRHEVTLVAVLGEVRRQIQLRDRRAVRFVVAAGPPAPAVPPLGSWSPCP